MNLQTINASASPEVQMNENFETLEHQAVYGLRQPVTTGLTWGYCGGRWGGFAITAGTLALTDDDDNYIVVAIATGAASVSTATTNWDDDANYVRVYKVTAASGAVTAVEDHRAGPQGVHGGAGAGGGGTGTVTNTGGALTANAVMLGAGTNDAKVMASLGTSGQVLTSAGAGSPPTWEAPSGGGGGGTKTYAVFTPMTSQPPASAYATLDTRNSIAVLDFDASTEESIFWVGVMPEGASLGSGLKVRIHWLATSATSGDVKWGAKFEAMTTDLDSDSFDTETTGTNTTSGTSGIETVTEITCTTIDSIAAGGMFRLSIARKAADGADTMTGDAEIVAVELRSAA